MPSTYIGPIFNDNGKSYADNLFAGEGMGDNAGNIALDIATPFTFKGINNIINAAGEKLFTNLSTPKNINFIRNIGNVPTVEENGMIWLSPSDRALTNMTWPTSFRTHRHYKSRPGANYLVINPKSLEGERFLSIDPMDTFIHNRQVPAKEVTFISGDPEARAVANSRGFNVMSSDEIDRLYQPIGDMIKENEEGFTHGAFQNGRFNINKFDPFRSLESRAYDDAVNNFIQT